MHLYWRMLLFTRVMRVYLMLTDMVFGCMLSGADWGAHNVAVIYTHRGWKEAAYTSIHPASFKRSPDSVSHSAPPVFMDWFTGFKHGAFTPFCSDSELFRHLHYSHSELRCHVKNKSRRENWKLKLYGTLYAVNLWMHPNMATHNDSHKIGFLCIKNSQR